MALPVMLWGAVLLLALAMLSWIDARTYRLPDALTLPLIACGIIQSWYFTGGLVDSLIGAGVGYFAFVALEVAYRRLRGKDGLGRGDAKLLAAGGAWCGWMGLSWIVLIASATGIAWIGLLTVLTHRRPGLIPFGPFLAFGIAVVWIGRTLAMPVAAGLNLL